VTPSVNVARRRPPTRCGIGGIELRKLAAHDVRHALTKLASSRLSRTVVVTRNALTRAIHHPEANRHIRATPH
jgi:hypothetical protein